MSDFFTIEFLDYRYGFLESVTNRRDMMRAPHEHRVEMAEVVYNRKTKSFEKGDV